MKTIFKIIAIAFVMISCGKGKKTQNDELGLKDIPKSIDLKTLGNDGLIVLKKQKLVPDSAGIIANIKLDLVPFKNGIYFRPFSERPAAGNRVEPVWFNKISDLTHYKAKKPSFGNFMNLGTFMMLQKPNGNYMVLLPTVSNTIGNTFAVYNNAVHLRMATYGTETENVEVPLLAYAESSNPYKATRMAWERAKEAKGVKGNINWRSDKTYPEPYKYLGWCSWEHYRTNINEDTILNAIKDIKTSDIPIRWVLVDDGYLDYNKGKRLLSFGVNKKKFPNGWSPITSQKDDKIKWMGIWRNMNGYMGGISPDQTMHDLDNDIAKVEYDGHTRYMPKISKKSADAFYNQMTADTKNNGFDMIKVDFQSNNYYFNRGSKNAIKGVHYNNTALEEHVKKYGFALLNSIAMENFNVFNLRYSDLIRGSIDYKTQKDRVDLTIVQNFTNAFWLGHISWIDQDMFYTSAKENVKLMAVCRALSGGPVYLSDNTKNMDETYLDPLIYDNGKIVGTLAPGVPLPESMLQNPFLDHKAFRVIAPLANKSAAIMAVNLNRGEVVKVSVSNKDYRYAGGLMQPYKGLWAIPEEGLIIYDHDKKEAQILSEDYSFKLATRKEHLFQLSPIKDGWSVIGNPNKYLSASTFTLLNSSAKEVKIKLKENGPLLIWSKAKKPVSKNFRFKDLGHGLWEGKLVKMKKDRVYTVKKS